MDYSFLEDIAGVNNETADRLSRSQDVHGWMLPPKLFQCLDKWAPHTVDGFTTFQKAQAPIFSSSYSDSL